MQVAEGAAGWCVMRRWNGQNGRMAKYLVSHPCQDACGTIETDRDVRGAPVYLCPGCDSQWYEPREEKVSVDHRELSPEPENQRS